MIAGVITLPRLPRSRSSRGSRGRHRRALDRAGDLDHTLPVGDAGDFASMSSWLASGVVTSSDSPSRGICDVHATG